jgi:hypothetical protein
VVDQRGELAVLVLAGDRLGQDDGVVARVHPLLDPAHEDRERTV